ncbi:hypothetical protein VSR69_39365 [Paraburkholderia phytofirmans]
MTGSRNLQDRDNEIQLINLFTAYLREEAVRLGNDFYDFALGPQDVELGADWLYHADSRFFLVEYKATRDGYRRESQKPRREALCRLFARAPAFRSSHRKCHFIAWSTSDYLEANVYERVADSSRYSSLSCVPRRYGDNRLRSVQIRIFPHQRSPVAQLETRERTLPVPDVIRSTGFVRLCSPLSRLR